MLQDLAKAISIPTYRVWKNNIGKGGLKIFLKRGNQRRWRLFEKRGGGDKYPLQTMNIFTAINTHVKVVDYKSFRLSVQLSLMCSVKYTSHCKFVF